VFALMSSDWRQYGGRNRYAGTREGITAVLVGDGRTLASEVKALLVAYSRMKSKAVARGPRQPAMVPVNPPWPPRGLPRPALTSFACRAISHERGGVEMLTLGAPRPSRGKVLVAGRKTIFKNRGVPLLLVVVRA
jgi:hypothetical protein